MKNIYLFICLFIVPFDVASQTKSIDSLKNDLKTTPQDTVRVNILNNISAVFIQTGHFDSANRYIKPSVELLEKLHYQTGAVMAYYNLAMYNFHIKEYKTGKFFLLKSLNAALLTHNKKNIAIDYKELADLYQLQSNFKQAKESNRKYVLYRDSLAEEESVKSAAEIKLAPNVKDKGAIDLGGNSTEAKTETINESYNKQVVYISIGVLLILSVLITLLLINRAKNKARKKLKENIELGQNEKLTNSIQLKNAEIKNEAFLQKIIESESVSDKNTENKHVTIEAATPIVQISEKELVDEKPIAKADVEPNIISGVNEKAVQTSTSEIIPIHINITTNKIETNSAEQKSVEETVPTIENKVGDIEDVENKGASTTVNKYYSNLIFLNQLHHFTLKVLGDSIKLLWNTNDEKNIVQFEVEKSVDSVQFVSIETITAKGFDSNNYEVFDYKPLPGINYYRLEVIDIEGNFIYSPVVQVEILPVSKLTLISYPTHVKDVIMVTAAGGKLPVTVNVYNKAGQKVFTIETPPTTTPVYLTSLATGTYTLQMKCEGKTILQQLIKVA